MASNKMKTSVVLAISIVLIDLSLVVAIQNEETPRQTNSTQRAAAAAAEQKQSIKDGNQRDSLETAPTITSVHHQVWTSSSSGRLDELSPELIGKLRQDVPFLAAYALRPRLVGQQPQSSTLLDEDQLQQPTGASKSYETVVVNNADGTAAARNSGAVPLQVGASAPQASRHSVAASPRLGDFSEFKVETSSLSKSEHHHKRSTSLRRPSKSKIAASKRPARARTGRKSREDSLSQLVRRVKSRRSSAASGRRSSGRSASGGRGNSRRRRGRRGGKRGSRRQRAGFKRSRSARFLQDPKAETNELDGEPNRSGVKGGDVKGGSGTKKRPFFAGGLKPKNEQADDSASTAGDNIDRNLEPDEMMKKPVDRNEQDKGDNLDDETDDSEEDIEQEPKRVGDDDVEEGGDTVLVEPKSDGVDDDPELPAAEDDGAEAMGDRDDGDSRDDSVNTIEKPEEGRVSTVTPSQGDPRGNRVNRQRPNELPSGGGSGGQDQVIGGGIGATTGSGGTPSDDRDGNSSGTGANATPGVEFADDNGGNRASSGNDGDAGRDELDNRREVPSGSGEPDEQADDGNQDGNFGERTRNGQESDLPRSLDGDGVKREHADDDSDLDYRDELDRSGDKPTTASGRDEPKDDSHQTTGKNVSQPHPKATGEHCDDGSHDHHGDHHHHHHDTIDWLRGAIPGEPNDDYPILSRANATDFSCADQKFPGYYADVEARCQIFHICQADGRQDSFLCPNGTIFSQRSLVCVWWNGFHCEDAPKFYHLNELLYKTTNGDESPQSAALPNLRPLDGSPQHPRPRAMEAVHNDDNEDDGAMNSPPIDSQTRGGKAHEANFRGGETRGVGANRPGEISPARGQDDSRNNKIAPDDDATIQRKSTDLDYDSPDEQRQARNSRRRRRASMRQAPPKLKSRRVSRNSRRAKLRHGIKPRRRA